MSFFIKHKSYIAFFVIIACLLAGCKAGGKKPAAAVSPVPSASAYTTATKAIATPTPMPTPVPTQLATGTIKDGWVVGIPDYVPRFTCGVIDYSQSSIVQGSEDTVFTLCRKGVKKADLDAYATALKTAGYDVALAEIGASYTLTASLEVKYGGVTVVVTLNEGNDVAQFTLGAPI